MQGRDDTHPCPAAEGRAPRETHSSDADPSQRIEPAKVRRTGLTFTRGIEEARHGQDRYFERAGCAAAEGAGATAARLVARQWIAAETWSLGATFSEASANLAGFGPRTFELLNLSRGPALKLEEPLKDDRVALGPVRPWGLCAGGSASGSFRVHGKGPPGMGGPNPQRAPHGARVRAPQWLPRKQGNTRPTPPTPPPGAPPRSQSLHKAGRRSRTTAAPTAASGAEGRLRGRRGSKATAIARPLGR